MTDDAITELTPILGSIRKACKAAGLVHGSRLRLLGLVCFVECDR
jgi:hypothetical protein